MFDSVQDGRGGNLSANKSVRSSDWTLVLI